MSEGGERDQFFKDRTIAMFSAITALQDVAALEGMDFDFVTYPVFKEMPDVGPQPYPIYAYPTKISEHKDAAFQVVSYLASDEFQMEASKKGSFVPASKNPEVLKVFAQDNPVYQGKNVAALRPKKYAIPGSVNAYNPGMSWHLDSQIKEVIQGTKDLNEALRLAGESADKEIQEAEMKKKK